MKCNSKKFLTIITMISLIIAISGTSLAHSGRTDSRGGHKDNQNKSGLGSYHYHCGGHPAHLHENGVCPYSTSSSSSSSSSKSTEGTSSSKSNSDSISTSSSVQSTPETEPIIEATAVEINESIISMKVGETTQLTATITPENTENKSVTWLSNDEDIATISSTGKVVALKPGTVNITVTTSNEKTDTIEITIEEIKEIEEENTIIAPILANTLDNAANNDAENADAGSVLLGLALIGGGGYWGYKKYKNKKSKK